MINNRCETSVVNNFINLCKSARDGYKNCKVYKIIKDLLMESGDTDYNDGSDKCHKQFCPESNSKGRHSYKGTLSVKVEDNGSTSSKFCITFKNTPVLDDRSHLVIGRIVRGLEVLDALNEYGSNCGVPHKSIFIQKCGEWK